MKRRNKNPEKVQKSIGSTILVFYYIDLIGSKLLHFTAYMPGNPEKTGHLAKDQTSRKDQTSGKDRISGKRPDVRQKTGYRYSAKKTRYLAKGMVPVSGKRRGTRYPAKDQIFGKRSDIWQKTRYPAKDRISGPTPLPTNLQKVWVHVWEEAGEALEYFSVGLG